MALDIQITEAVSLKLISENAKQQMAWQVREGPFPEHCMPTRLKIAEVEIAQLRALNFNTVLLRRRRADLDASHSAQAARRLARLPLDFDSMPSPMR